MSRKRPETRLTCRHAGLIGAATAALLIGSPAGAAERLYGLVVGIDDYVGTVNDLGGAVNDANDIAAALGEAGATRIELLRDAEASKAAISQAWLDLVAEAETGDTIVFSFAGHGSQEPEPPGRNGEEDGHNENFLLGAYTANAPGLGERIVDDEIFDWLTMADDKGIEVIFVADSCHSGTMYRAVGAAPVRYRTGTFEDPDLAEDFLELPPPKSATSTEADFNSVTFISATQDSRLTPELQIEGQSRGALSWAFARAVRGAADRDDDGRLSQHELLGYLVPTVQSEAENQQIPAVLPLRSATKPVIRIRAVDEVEPVTPVEPPPPQAGPGGPAPVLLFVGDAAGDVPPVSGVEITADSARADLIWDAAAGTVDHRIGGRVADGVTPATLAPVLSKWSALAFIKAHVGDDPIALTTPSGNQTYGKGEIVEFAMDGAQLPYLTMFNLPPNGRVEFFIPSSAEESQEVWTGRPMKERFRVDKPPFGAEHMVAILTEEPALALHQALRSMANADDAGGLAAALRATLADTKFQAGVVGIYTSGDPL